MRKLLSVLVAGAVTLAPGACDDQPVSPEPDVSARHGATGVIEASADYRAVDTEAAELNGFEMGDDVGTLSVVDDGSELTVEGSASGLDPAGVHVSLFYDKASSVQGPRACEPGRGVGTGTDHPLSLTLAQMEIGDEEGLAVWDVEEDGSATLGPTSTAEYVSADRIGTVSIRDARINGGFGPEAVVACGKVVHDPAR